VTRILHTGDTHVGYRQYHTAERRADFLAAFEQVVADAVADDVDAVVHAGDLFNDRRPALPDLLGTIDVLRDLRDADVPFLAVVGNHEGTRGAQWMDLFERLGLGTRLGADPVRVGDVACYGLDYVPRSKRADLDYDFAANDAERAVLVGHGLFQPFPHGDWDLEAVLDAASVDFDAVLLGDDHQHDTAEVRGAIATYCGSTERASASERDPRGYNLVTVEDGDVRLSRRGIDTRDFVFVDETLAEGEGTALLRERIREADVEDAVVVVTIEGEGEDVVPAEIEAFGDEQGALVTRVNDRRERETVDAAPDVNFVDPDAAVDERLRASGFSAAAHGVDDVVRGDVADTNVRDVVEEHVSDLLGDDPAAFEAVEAPENESPDDDDDAETADRTADDADESQVTMGDYL
jgi:DNA repair exonuclease SbcCD nuclease subunit